MAATILLDTITWDLVLDADGNIAVADEPYALSQDVASAARTFLGEVYWDTTIGVPYLAQIFGNNPPLGLIKQLIARAALTVAGVTQAKIFLASLSARALSGQIQFSSDSGLTLTAPFTVVSPQV